MKIYFVGKILLVFKNISTFESEIEIKIGKKDSADELIKKTLNLLDIELQSKLDDLRRYNDRLDSKKNDDYGDDNNSNGGFDQQQQQQIITISDVPNFEPNNIQPEISNFHLSNLSQQNIKPPNVSNKEEEDPILQQIDNVLSEQVKIKTPETEIGPNLGKCFDMAPDFKAQ